MSDVKDPKAPVRYFAPNTGIDKCPGCGKIPQGAGWRITVPGKWFSWHADCFERQRDHTRDADKVSPKCELCDEQHPLPHDGSCLL